MGDSPQTHVFPKAIIFLFLFLALYITLIALTPPEFFYEAQGQISTEQYSFLSLEDIRNIRYIKTVNITRPGGFFSEEEFDFTPDANFKMRVIWYSEVYLVYNTLHFQHMTWESPIGFPSPHYDDMLVENTTQPYVTKAMAILHWDTDFNTSIFDPVQCQHVRTKVWVIDTNSTRNNIESAWNEGELTVAMGFGYDDFTSKQTSMDILGRILTFQAPEVYGLTGDMATIITVILTIPFYAMVGVLIMLIVIAFVPF